MVGLSLKVQKSTTRHCEERSNPYAGQSMNRDFYRNLGAFLALLVTTQLLVPLTCKCRDCFVPRNDGQGNRIK